MDQCQNVANSEAADGDSTESTGAIQVTSVEPTSCADQVVVEESSPNVVEQQKTEEATPENVTIPSEEVVEPEKNEEMQPIATEKQQISEPVGPEEPHDIQTEEQPVEVDSNTKLEKTESESLPKTVEEPEKEIEEKTTVFDDVAETIRNPSFSDDVKFGVLCSKIMAIASSPESNQDANVLTDYILNLLITDDLQRIRKPETLRLFFRDYLKLLPLKLVAEILSVLIAVFKKSLLNLEAAKGLLLDSLTQTFHFDNLIKHFIREIINLQTAYSCDVKELKAILKQSEEDPRLLHFVRNANLLQRGRPNAFFALPGSTGSAIALPPIQRWPQQNGWTFITWFRLEPNSTNSQPYLYYFRTSKSGVGYSAHFTGNCLVLTSMKIKGKGFQHCIPYEFSPFKWFHCAITYITKWRGAEIKVYVNGQMTANTDMAWQVQTTDMFDKCYIGGTSDLSEAHLFSGQMSAIYLFHEALNPSQICAIHRLGPSYMGQYRYNNESQIDLPVAMRRVLYEEKLSSALISLYTPVAVEGDTLCLQSAPKGNTSYFTSSPHAALLGQTVAICTQSISATLQSIGGIKALLPLLHRFTQQSDPEACSTLIGFICDLLESSPHWFGNEVVYSHGFIIIASLLAKNPRILINEESLEIMLNLTKSLISAAGGADSLILKQLMDSILFNSSLWIYVDAKLQLRLYCYLATEFLSGANNNSNGNLNVSSNASGTSGVIFSEVRRISTVLQLLHSLKYYYWLVEEKSILVKAKDASLRPTKNELLSIRSYILLFIKQLILKGNGVHHDELQAILNYLTTVSEDENVLDVLQMLQSLMCEHPSSMIPAFDAKHGVKTVFKLIESTNEEIRIQALKLLGYFLSRSTQKRKQDVMGPYNLYMLLCERLMKYTPLRIDTYNALFEILTETAIETIRASPGTNPNLRIENPMILKVIATLIIEGKKDPKETSFVDDTAKPPHIRNGPIHEKSTSLHEIKRLFISDLWKLLVNNRDNRRLVLQMSVWQHWLINLIEDKNEMIRDQVLAIFRILLYHAIKYEYGGWRVWIDTLAIIHAKVSLDDFMMQFGNTRVNKVYEGTKQTKQENHIREAVNGDTVDNKHEAATQESKISEVNEEEEGRPEDDPRPEDERGLSSPPITTSEATETNENIKPETEAEKVEQFAKSEGATSGEETTSGPVSSIEVNDEEEGRPEAERELSSTSNVALSETTEIKENSETQATELTNKSDEDNVSKVQQPTISAISSNEVDKQSDTGAEKPHEEDEFDEKADEKEFEEKSAPISTISSNTKSEMPNENSPTSKTVTDIAPTRKYRRTNKQKEYYNNLLGGDQKLPTGASKISATPAFRIPEFRWSHLHLKLLNDLLFSVECDLQMWRSQGVDSRSDSSAQRSNQLDQILQNADNQIYIINAIHLVSQLSDNIIIASGGLLPLLAAATGGSGSTPNINSGGEGLSSCQANSLLFRLVNLVDILCFAATHINFGELEAEKNMSSGGILRQNLRLVCTVAVKNCLTVQKAAESGSLNVNDLEALNPKDLYNIGTSIAAAAELFGVEFTADSSDLINYKFENSDLGSASITAFMPLQPLPIKDPTRLLQEMDINRLRACIYRDADADTRQSQFLALATLYFISVLMVSKYRDIIEPKSQTKASRRSSQGSSNESMHSNIENIEAGTLDPSEIIKPIEIPKTHLDANIGEILTQKLEATLSSVCPLLREIMCDFANFLSKTLLGSHGQDLVSKEAVRTFRRTNASPVELVMLLCSQEWQNTLQKNAGLAFIELINEGRLLSHAMKDHIVRVAMEAEFILNRLRADDVAKHETFTQSCTETTSGRTHEENLINSLIISAKRRDWMLYTRFKENLKRGGRKYYKLDTWEDDARRKRRFVCDPFGSDDLLEAYQRSMSSTSENTTINVDGNAKSKPGSAVRVETPTESGENGDSEQKDKEEKKSITSDKTEEAIANPLILPKPTPSLTTRTENDEESELFLWENDDSNQDSEANAEFSGSVLYTVECSLIWCIYAIEGVLQITANELFFEAHSTDIEQKSVKTVEKSSKKIKSDQNDMMKGLSGSGSKGMKGFKELDLMVLRYCDLLTYNGKIALNEIRAIFSRRFLLQQNAIEIFLAQRTSIMFAFPDFEAVKKVVKYLPPVGVGVKYGIPQSRRASLMSPKQLFAASNMTQKWQKREISNFEYLMFLNTIAGRTYQDLNQYPVFPWILTNYESNELDLAQPTNFRDLSKPIGALNGERRAEFIERFSSWDNALVPAFHYGTHYSTAAFTLGWLVRLQPFYSSYMALQDGRLEDESRLFMSVRDAWIGSLMGGQQNVKELIPEFFYLPEIFLGNSALTSAELPPWADSAEHFIRVHRMALESDLVSCQLHQWIDLIFGYKQRGPEAVRAVNVFYYLTYEGNIDLASVSDQSLREAIESQIRHFGQTPSQLTTEPHPPRSSALHVSPLMFSPVMDEVCMSVKFPFNASVTHIASCASHNASNTTATTIVTINSHQQFYLHKWNSKESSGSPFTMDQALVSPNSTMKRQLVDTTNLCGALPCHYIVTLDAKHIIMSPFYDNSFRVYSTETGKLTQIIYGHRGMVSCLARSECNVAADFYIASGSEDCSVLLWTWNAKYAQVEGNGSSSISNPLPKLTLCGHESTIIALLISAELGLIVSASRNTILIHTTSQGECITEIDIRKRNMHQGSRLNIEPKAIEEVVETTHFGDVKEANLEASMLGQKGAKELKRSTSKTKSETKADALSVTSGDVGIEAYNDEQDYLITNLVMSRELAFIIGIAHPIDSSSDEGDSKPSSAKKLSRANSRIEKSEHSQSSLLFSYNLRGCLMKCISFGAGNFSRPRDTSLLTATRDGEYIIMTENANVIKILRTFDLTPLYALNTSELATQFQGEQNRIKSLTLADFKFLLVGLENGKLIVYNVDFNRWHHEYSSRY